MIQSRSTFFKEGKYQHDPQFFSQRTELFRGWSRNCFSLVEYLCVLRLAEIQAVMQFLQHNQLRSFFGTKTDITFQFLYII